VVDYSIFELSMVGCLVNVEDAIVIAVVSDCFLKFQVPGVRITVTAIS
jgi:hypothetical protein